MLYIERQPSKRSIVLLIVVGLLLYTGAMWLYELRPSDEGLLGAMSREMMWSGDYVKTHLYGRPVREYPLYSWLVSLFSFFGSPTIWSLRLPTVLSVFALALLSGLAARRLQSNFSGFIAACVVLLSIVSFKVGFRAQVALLQSFLTCLAWWSWYHLGVEEKRWNGAWEVSLFFVFLGVLNVGLEAVFWFYLPLLFMPRQVNAKMRMQMPSHLVSALTVMVLIMAWEWVTPDQPLMPWNREPGLLVPSTSSGGYLWHLLVFPCKAVYYLLPWSILLWSPFCIALRPFERAPIGCRYFRVIVLTIFLAVWFFPGSSPLKMLPLLGPTAILIGVHFEIVIRRYKRFLDGMVKVMSWLAVCGCLLGAGFWGLVGLGVIRIMDVASWLGLLFGLLLLTQAVILCLVELLGPGVRRMTFRSRVIWCICACRLLSLLTIEAYHEWNQRDRRWAGETLAGLRSPIEVIAEQGDLSRFLPYDGKGSVGLSQVDHIYYCPSGVRSFLYLSEFSYLGKPIVFVPPRSALERTLPRAEERVYVLSCGVPAVASREWRALSPAVWMGLHRKTTVSMRSSEDGADAPWLSIERVPDLENGLNVRSRLQLYEGVLLAE